MRSITNEIYEELNKKKNPVGINRTDVLQHIIDIIFDFKLQEDHKTHIDFCNKSDDPSMAGLSEEVFYLLRKKQILDAIKSSYTIEKEI